MIYTMEHRKGANALGRRDLEVQDIPKEMLELLQK